MNPRIMTRMYGQAYGFNTDRRVKPVHFATGFFVALLGAQYEQQILNKTVAYSDSKTLHGDYELPNLHRLLLSEDRISQEIDLEALQVLRKQLRSLSNNDGAVYPSYTGKAGFGCDYTSASGDVLTRTKDNDGFTGYFVYTVLNQSSAGQEILDTVRTWLGQDASTWRLAVQPLLEANRLEEDPQSRYEAKGFGDLDSRRLRRISKKMELQTLAVNQLCEGADQLMASETKLRVIIIGLCMWLFRYLVLEGLETPFVSGTLLVDMLGDSSSKMRAQSRWSFSRVREGLIDAFSRFESSGRFEGSEEAWSYIQRQLASRPKFEEFYRELGLRSGMAQPRANRISAKHFELQPETLRAAVMSVVTIDDGSVPITELLDRLFNTWGLCFGGRPLDDALLAKLGYTGLDQDQDLTPNTEALTTLLAELGLATRLSDGVVMCHAKDRF